MCYHKVWLKFDDCHNFVLSNLLLLESWDISQKKILSFIKVHVYTV